MKQTSRRTFMFQIAATGSALVATRAALAQAGPALPEADPQAVALGYKEDTSKVDVKKFPKHEATQKCSNCALYQGKPADAAGACPLFAGKQVKANGWCSAWAKKA
jgi:High potential iron-sulfur protein